MKFEYSMHKTNFRQSLFSHTRINACTHTIFNSYTLSSQIQKHTILNSYIPDSDTPSLTLTHSHPRFKNTPSLTLTHSHPLFFSSRSEEHTSALVTIGS